MGFLCENFVLTATNGRQRKLRAKKFPVDHPMANEPSPIFCGWRALTTWLWIVKHWLKSPESLYFKLQFFQDLGSRAHGVRATRRGGGVHALLKARSIVGDHYFRRRRSLPLRPVLGHPSRPGSGFLLEKQQLLGSRDKTNVFFRCFGGATCDSCPAGRGSRRCSTFCASAATSSSRSYRQQRRAVLELRTRRQRGHLRPAEVQARVPRGHLPAAAPRRRLLLPLSFLLRLRRAGPLRVLALRPGPPHLRLVCVRLLPGTPPRDTSSHVWAGTCKR